MYVSAHILLDAVYLFIDALYIPGQHKHQKSKYESPDISRNLTSKCYEHPTNFEKRILKETCDMNIR